LRIAAFNELEMRGLTAYPCGPQGFVTSIAKAAQARLIVSAVQTPLHCLSATSRALFSAG
jgi:hypothetical protein